MDILKHNLAIDFMGKQRYAAIVSSLLVVAAIISMVARGFNFGIDFTGGTLIEAGYPQAVDLAEVRSVLIDSGYADAQAQHFGTSRDVLVRLAPREGMANARLSEEVLGALRKGDPGVEMRRVEFVGPQVGDELTEQGGLAMIYALIGILIYIVARFNFRLAPGAVIALIHDVLIVMGIFSIWQIEFDLTVLAALLAVIGYSLNDTIVVYDRIRENFRKMRKGLPRDIINTSINQTLSRTLMTSLTTLIVLVSLFIFGGEVIHSFAIALILGVLVGTYSSVYVASTAALVLGISKADLMTVKKEGAGRDEIAP
jgi:preprotein translocase subunit SecF